MLSFKVPTKMAI